MPSYQDDTAGRCLSVMKKNGGLLVLLAAVIFDVVSKTKNS